MAAVMTMDNRRAEPVDSHAGVAYAALPTPAGMLHLYGTERGLLWIGLPRDERAVSEARLRRMVGECAIVDDVGPLRTAIDELTAYVAGELREFTVPLDPRGTAFQRRVWQAVAAVPFGVTKSYRDIAVALGQPTATRAVGLANGANPLPIIIPCHRIIGSNGTLTGYGGGLEMKRWLLRHEGVLLT